MSALVIQQYDLENMGKKLGRFLFSLLSLKNERNKQIVLLPKMGSLSTQAVEKNLYFIY